MDKHLSSQFDADLNQLCAQVMQMGGLVEQQLTQAIQALAQNDVSMADEVLQRERRINMCEMDIDRECSNVIAKRQPTARDLRLLMAVSKCTANLERAGDEAERIARLTKRLMQQGMPRGMAFSDIRLEADLAGRLLRKALDAFARLDVIAANEILRDDRQVDEEFEGFVRKLITYVMEDPRMIGSAIDLLFAAKAIERIGDHAKNIAEMVIYVAKGTDVRHSANPQEATTLSK